MECVNKVIFFIVAVYFFVYNTTFVSDKPVFRESTYIDFVINDTNYCIRRSAFRKEPYREKLNVTQYGPRKAVQTKV